MCHVAPAALQVNDKDRIKVGCSIKFSGNIAPSVNCTWSAGYQWETIVGFTTNNTVALELTVLVTASLDGQSVQCETQFFNDSQRSSGQSASLPLYQHTWNSSLVHLSTGNHAELLQVIVYRYL